MGTALSPSPLRGEGWGEGRVLAKAFPIVVGAHPVRDRRGNRCAAVAHWVRSYRERTPLFAPAFDLPSPMPRAGGRRNSPKGGRHGCRPGDRQGRTPCRSTPPPVCDPAGARHRGGLSFGYFSLAKQRKVTRAAAAVRKPAVPRGLPSVAGEPGRGIATTGNRGSGSRPTPGRRTREPRRKAVAHRVRSHSGSATILRLLRNGRHTPKLMRCLVHNHHTQRRRIRTHTKTNHLTRARNASRRQSNA